MNKFIDGRGNLPQAVQKEFEKMVGQPDIISSHEGMWCDRAGMVALPAWNPIGGYSGHHHIFWGKVGGNKPQVGFCTAPVRTFNLSCTEGGQATLGIAYQYQVPDFLKIEEEVYRAVISCTKAEAPPETCEKCACSLMAEGTAPPRLVTIRYAAVPTFDDNAIQRIDVYCDTHGLIWSGKQDV